MNFSFILYSELLHLGWRKPKSEPGAVLWGCLLYLRATLQGLPHIQSDEGSMRDGESPHLSEHSAADSFTRNIGQVY